MPDTSFYIATILNLAINLVYTLLALLVAFWAFRFFDRTLFTQVDFMEEIKKGNIAAAIFASTKLLFIAIVTAIALRG